MLCGVTVRCSFGAGDTRIANDPGESVGGGELADTAGGRMEQYAPASYNLPINWQPFPDDKCPPQLFASKRAADRASKKVGLLPQPAPGNGPVQRSDAAGGPPHNHRGQQ